MDEPRTEQISFRVGKTLREELDRRAAEKRLSLSDYVRKIVVDALATSDGEGQPGGNKVAAILQEEVAEHRQELLTHRDEMRSMLAQHLKLLNVKGEAGDLKAALEIHRLREDLATTVVALLHFVGNFELQDAIDWAQENLAPSR